MDKDELQLFLRIGNLIDATVQAARGLANVGDQASRTPAAGIPIPAGVILTPVLDGIDINFDAVDFDNLAHYEIDIDISSVFSDPVTKKAFSNKFVIRGLDSGVFFVRIRVVDRTGKVGEYSDTEEVTLGDAGFDEDTDFFLPEQRNSKIFNNETVSKLFFVNSGDNALVAMGVSSGPGGHNRRVSWSEGDSGEAIIREHVHVATLEENEIFLKDQARGFGGEAISDFFYTYGHNPGQGFDAFYSGPDPPAFQGGQQPAFYAKIYFGATSMYTMLHFFNVDQATDDGNTSWDVTHGDEFVGEIDGAFPALSFVSWMNQATVKF